MTAMATATVAKVAIQRRRYDGDDMPTANNIERKRKSQGCFGVLIECFDEVNV